MNPDILRLVLCMLATIPLSLMLRALPSRSSREYFSLVCALCLQWVAFGWSMWVVYLQQALAFALLQFRRGGWVTFEGMLAVSLFHLYQIVYNYGGWTMDASALLMILICKHSLLAYALQDGATPPDHLTPQQLKNRVTAVSLWDFIGYSNFLPTSLVGPPLQYVDYLRYMQCSAVEGGDRYGQLVTTMKEVVVVGVVHLLGQIYVPYEYLKTEEYYGGSTWYAMVYAYMVVTLLRFKYYTGWKIAMAAVYASGVGGQINTCNIYVVETSVHMRQKVNNWNIGVQEWLRKCIYQRSGFRSKAINQLYVFLISAFWHGFYLGYYITFSGFFLQLHLQTMMFRYFKKGNVLYDAYVACRPYSAYVGVLVVNSFFNLSGISFLVLDGEYCWKYFLKVGYLHMGIMLALVGVLTCLPVKKQLRGVQK